MALDIQKALAAGYSEAELVDHLAKDSTLDVAKARQAGYTDTELLGHLSKPIAPPVAAPVAPNAPKVGQGKNAGIPMVEPDEAGNFMRGVGNVPGQFQETWGGAKALAGLLTNSKDLVQSGLESMEEGKLRQTGKESDSFTNAWKDGIGSVLTEWLPYQIGSGVGNLAETGTFMLLGAVGGGATTAGVGALPGAVAGAVSKTLVKQGIKEAAEKVAKESGKEAAQKFVEAETKRVITEAGAAAGKQYAKTAGKSIGATAGMVGQAGISGAGEVTGRAIDEAGGNLDQVSLARVVPSAIAHGVADYFVNKIGLGALKISEKSLGNLALDIGKQVAVTGTKEVPAEMIQTIAERYGAKLSLTDAEALREYVDTVAASYGMSVGPGSVGGARTNLAHKFEAAAKESTTAEDLLRKQATSAADQTQAPPPPVNADLVAGLTPAMGADNKALANVSADTTAAGTELKAIEDAKAAEEAGKVKTAEELLVKADAGEQVKRSDIHAIAKSLGVKLPLDARTNKDKIELIRAHVTQQGAPNAATTVSDTSGTSAGVAAPTSANEPAPAGVAGTQPSGVVSDGATTPAAPVGKEQQPAPLAETQKPKTLADLTPEVREEVSRRQAELSEIEAEKGTENKLYRNKLNFLNKLLADNGVTGTLSAKRTKEGYLNVEDLIKEGSEATAVPGKEKTEQQQEVERQAAYEESLGKEIPNYSLSEEDKRLYNETRDEVNSQVDAANARRRELVAAVDKAATDFDNAEEGKAENDAWDRLVATEKALNDHGEEQHKLPEYSKHFAADYKDIYFGNIKYGNKAEHRNAAKALQAYMRKMRGRSKEQLKPEERRVVNHYEENRTDFQKIFNVTFPVWSSLTPEQKYVFAQEMMNNSGQMQNVAFAKLGVKLIQDSKEMSEGEKREKQNTIERQEQVRQESEAQQEKDRKTREDYERNKPAYSMLPNKVLQMVMDNDLQGILEYMSSIKTTKTSPYKMIMKAVAKSLLDLKLNTKIKIVEDLDGDLAQYDPATDTIYVTQEGLSSSTILHEIVHAGTTKVINEYLYGNRKSLSMGQLNAIKQLERIMEATRSDLAADHPDAYKNLFEFVSYALTNDQLQQDLHGISAVEAGVKAIHKRAFRQADTEAVGTNLPEKKSEWSRFKLAIAGVLKMGTDLFGKGQTLNKEADVNFVMEIAAAFDDILSKPTEPIFLPALPAKGKPPAAKKTVNLHKAELGVDNVEYQLPKEDAPPTLKERFDKARGNINTWRNTARRFQDDRYRIKAHDRILDLSGKLIREGKDKMNNVYEQIVLAVGDAKNFFNMYVQQPARELDEAVKAFADATGYKTKRALEELHKILEAVHEPERRMVKYLLAVPLSTKANLTHNGKKISAAQRRADIIKLLDTHTITAAQAQQLRDELNSIVFEKDANGELVRDPEGNPKPNMTYVDPAGSTPKPRKEKGADIKRGIDYTSEAYTATGMNLTDAKKIRDDLKNSPQAAEIQKVMDSIQQLHLATTELNKLANYWSQPVSNRVAFYGFENYVPLKGNPKHSEVDEDIDFDSVRNGRELQDRTGAMEGRTSVSKNPILQTMTDATRASLRAGRRNLTQAIKNAITNKDANGNTVIKGSVKKTIKFEERDTVDLSDLKGETTIFHYNEDGSIDVLVVADKNLRDSIRRTYKQIHPLVEFANKWTSRIGQMHTRYNYNFAPLNFVRDALTNTWNIGASDLGPLEAARYLKNVAFLAANGGMYKAMQVAILYPKGDTQSMRALETLAKKDPYIRDMVEYIRQGGMVSHLNGMSLQSNFEELHKKVGQSGILNTVEDINHFADVWTNMFELASRAAAYSVAKNNYIQNDKLSESEARTKAAVFTKNLANFEQVGEWGKMMGAAYMFFRPAATGAVRAIEAVSPAFTSLDAAEKRLPPEIAQDPAAKAKYLENFKKLQRNSRLMSGALFGLGIAAYTMAFMTADDDDLGRNAVATDNMEQWTRFARFHVPRGISEAMGLKEPLIFQIPWGFGLGAFAAAGAQLAGVAGGSQKMSEALPNIFVSVMLDSFVPIPVSRIPVTESPFHWLLDSIAPSVTRPILEFTMNKNGLGRDINSAAQRRMGDAYTGGDNIPEMWKDLARWSHDVTDGYIDVSPNTLYFLTNSYVDGISRVAETTYGINDVAAGQKNFNPKTDLPLFGSFFGSRSSVDAREFARVEREIQHMEKVINDFKTQPEKYAEYTAKYPMDEAVVEIYNKMINQELNPLRADDKTIRLDRNLTPADRAALLKINKFQEDLVKRQMIDVFKAYGVEP